MKTKVHWMTFYLLLFFAVLLSGCVNDVSQEPPHNKLVGTEWRLKTDVYVIRYDDSKNNCEIFPCSEEFKWLSNVYPDFDKKYKEENIGRYYSGKTIVAGYRKGTVFKIVRVLKQTQIEIGTRYLPMMLPANSQSSKELNGYWLYDQFVDKGVLNPAYAEPVKHEDIR